MKQNDRKVKKESTFVKCGGKKRIFKTNIFSLFFNVFITIYFLFLK